MRNGNAYSRRELFTAEIAVGRNLLILFRQVWLSI